MTTFTSAAFMTFTLIVVALSHPTEIIGATVIIGPIILMLALGIGGDLQRIEKRLFGSSDHEHDERIERQADRESEEYWKRLKRLKAQKERLPKINTFTIPNWEAYLVEQAENLRDVLGRVVHDGARDVPMDYSLAHALAEFAHYQNNLEAKSTEWEIKRIEVLCLMRKREFSFKSTVDGEQELRELEKQIATIEEQIRKCGHNIWVEYHRIRARDAAEQAARRPTMPLKSLAQDSNAEPGGGNE
jgi:hypothetical protein